jgi:hypothetical protein
MTPKVRLLLLQALGVLSIVPYPAVFIASLMSLGGGGSETSVLDLPFKIFFAGTLVYPAVWLLLWVLAWRAYRAGRPSKALVLSSPPAIVAVSFFLLFGVGDVVGRFVENGERGGGSEGQIAAAREQSSLAAAILEFLYDDIEWSDLQKAIAAAPAEELSKPVTLPPFGAIIETPQVRPESPLAILLDRSLLGLWFDEGQARPHFLDAARLLMQRGATLSPAEVAEDAQLVFLADAVARQVPLPDPRAYEESPIADAIMTARESETRMLDDRIREAAEEDPTLLTRVSTAYGSPLKVAILRKMNGTIGTLIYNGAVLAPAERQVPSLARQLEEVLQNPLYRERYEAALKAERR